ncbi:hypothetical protein HMPREF2086_01052 [Helicobacter macacae MIT 99-5501]|uniref:YhdP central domain-containing protein n=1 Tax=Helicobacter macacae MIT 99-5501 TaxID=1357400 RepID=V8C768_9HELI|nr:hypothetical protein HMPREF2086_01052 [Helicobacter macacae MIT 99-5501]
MYSGVRIEQMRIAKVSISGLYLRLHNKFILEIQEIDLSQAMSEPKPKKDFDSTKITDYVKYAIWGIAYFEHLDINRIVLSDKYTASVSYDGAMYSLSFPKLQAVFDVSTKDNNMLLDIKYLTMSEPDFSVGGRIIYAPKSKKVGFGLVVLPMDIEDLRLQNAQSAQSSNPTKSTQSKMSQTSAVPAQAQQALDETKLFLQGSSDFKTLKLKAKTTKIKNLDFLRDLLKESAIFPSLNQWLFASLDFDCIELLDSSFDISLSPKNFTKTLLQNTTAQAQVQKVAYYLPASLQAPQNPSKKQARFPTPFTTKKLHLTMKDGNLTLAPESLSYDSLSLQGTSLTFSFEKSPTLHIALASPKVLLSQNVHNLFKYFNISLPIDSLKGDIKAQVGITIDLAKKSQNQTKESNSQDSLESSELALQATNSTNPANPADFANSVDFVDSVKDLNIPSTTPTHSTSPVAVQGSIIANDATIKSSNIDVLTKSALVQININPSTGDNSLSIETKNTSYENLFDIDTKTTINLSEKRLKTSLFVYSLRISTNPQINERILSPENIKKRENFIKELHKKSTQVLKPIYYASNAFTSTKSDIANVLLARLDSTKDSSESSEFVMPKPLETPFEPKFDTPSTNSPNTTTTPQSTTPMTPKTTPPSINLPTPPKKEKNSQKKTNSIIEKTGDMLLPKTSTPTKKQAPNEAEQIAKLHPNDNDDGEDIGSVDESNANKPNEIMQSPKTPSQVAPQKSSQKQQKQESKKALPQESTQKDLAQKPKKEQSNKLKPTQETPKPTPKSSGKIITKGVELDFGKPMSEATMRAKIIELIKAQNEDVFTYDIFRADKSSLPQIDIDMDFSSDEVSISVPSLQTYAKMLNSQIVIAVRDFKLFTPHSPLMKYLGLNAGSAIVHLKSANELAFEVQIKDFPTFLLKKDKTPLKDFVFQGQYKDKKLRVKSAPQGLISFESYDNTMLAKFNNIDIDINALLSSKIPAIEEAFSISDEKSVVFTKEQILAENEFLRQKRRYERQNNLKPHIIAIEARNIVGFYKEITLPFDDFNAKIRDDRITADATYGNGIANIDIIHGNTLFKAGNFGAEFLNRIIGRKIVEGGLFEAGGIYKNDIFNGEISMQNTSFKGFAIVQNIIGLIDTIPSLVMFRSPGLSGKGYEVKNGKIMLGLNTQYIALESIDLIGKTMDVKGSGIIEVESSEVDIGLSISTLKSLTSVLNKIPIIGYLILGKDGKITTQVSIDGTLENPKSQVSLAEDILSAPLNIIKRAFTPVDMLIDEVVKSID